MTHRPSGLVALHDVFAAQMRYSDFMKAATLPSIRIEQELRDALEASLNEGETLSEFIEASVRGRLRQRNEQAEFVARGLASLEEARRSGITVPADVAVDDIWRKLDRRAEQERQRRAAPKRK
ncbi:MAG: YlcI/YnfO family protein [Betaproteobacteria bacterium]